MVLVHLGNGKLEPSAGMLKEVLQNSGLTSSQRFHVSMVVRRVNDSRVQLYRCLER